MLTVKAQSASSSASSISADGECKDLGISFVHAKNGGSKGASSNSAIPAKKGCKKSDSVLRSDIFSISNDIESEEDPFQL